jgi:AcrR family transcriptional regulator
MEGAPVAARRREQPLRAELSNDTFAVAPGAAAPAAGKALRHLGTDDRSSQRIRIVDATLVCLARQGVHKTTFDDIARQSGFSRATVYRAFPGGKEAVLAAVVDTELARFFSQLGVALGRATDIEDVLVAGITEAARRLLGHRALAFVCAHEPALVTTHLAFNEMDRVLALASDFAAPFLGRWLEPDQAMRAAEWAVRIVLTYVGSPSPDVDLTSTADVTHMVQRFVLPGVQALRFAR